MWLELTKYIQLLEKRVNYIDNFSDTSYILYKHGKEVVVNV